VTQYLLNTDTCIYLIKRQPPALLARLQSLDIATVSISSITLSELEYGVAKSARPQQNKLALAQFLAPLNVRLVSRIRG
jgi:tRNA(fMet)-specific endonuclease VapC